MLNKKVIALVAAAALASCLALAGCGGTQAASSNTASASTTSESAAASDTATSASAAATSTAAASESTAAANTAATSSAASTADSYIGDQAAIDIALTDAGFSVSDVTELKAELDLDDAVVHYDIDFKQGGWEYDYDIDAVSGAILSANSEIDD